MTVLAPAGGVRTPPSYRCAIDLPSDRTMLRVRFGHEHDALHIYAGQCPGCAVHRGGVHRLGCDVEQCPTCRPTARLADCGCAGDLRHDEP